MKQYQKEFNEIHAERIAKTANPLVLIVATQQYLDPYYQAPKSHKSYAPPSKQSSSTRSNASTKYKGKEIAKPITPPSESASEEDSDPEEARRDKDMQKNLALIAKYFKKIYKPANNNLITSSNSRNKNVDTSPRYKNDNQTGQFRNQRIVLVAGARETVPTTNSRTDTKPLEKIVQLILFIVDSGCTKHMTGNLKLLCNFVEKYLGTVHFGNDQFAPILGYGDLVQGNITINRVYYVEGLNHNLFSIGQFYYADLEVAFRKSTCFVRDLQGNNLLTGNYGSDLYIISLQETTSSTLICFMAKASPTQAWLWHQRLSYLNIDYINLLSKKDIVIGLPKLKYVKDQLCSSCEVSKAKRSLFKIKVVPSSKGRLNLLHLDLCTEFLNKTLHTYFKEEGIEHQTSTRTSEQNDIVERLNRTLVEAARTMLSASKFPLFFWAKAITTACYTQNRSIIIPTHEKTAYHIINDIKPSMRHLPIFGCTCYLTRDGENLDKVKEKGDMCILFDEIKEMTETSVDNNILGLALQRQKASDYDNSGPMPQLQNVSPSADTTTLSQQELDLLFGPLYDEFFTAGTSSVNKSSSPTDNSKQQDTPPTTNIQSSTEPTTPTTNVNAEENNDN
ncbi:retrovirus-related pol polyprotein from transposon TNT 1-94 [Tanacetum coccineum]